jgi:hypothetical protein
MNRTLALFLICVSVLFAAGCGGGGMTSGGGGTGGGTRSVIVTVSPRNTVVTFATTQQFNAAVQNATDLTVTWAVDSVMGGNATVGTVTGAGLYTPPASVGKHTITVTSNADPTKSASATLYISDYAGTFTYHNDNARTGQNLGETVLSPANVNSSIFGKLFTYSVDGFVYAQPLYVENLNMGAAGTHNVVFVATEHDSVYAFDADNSAVGQLWQVSFLGAGVTTVPNADVGTGDIVPEIGITSTPVIDPVAKLLYVVAKTKETPGPKYVHRLHALSLIDGSEQLGGPVVIGGSVPGTGDGDDGAGNVPWNDLRQLQRCALLLDHGVVYICSASHGDNDPYHGWVFAYDAATLARLSLYNTTPNGARGGIWHAGGGPAADAAGNVFVVTGNGTFDANSATAPRNDYGDSVIRLAGSSLAIAAGDTTAYFAPFNQATLEGQDLDLGSGAPLLLPDQGVGPAHLLLMAGKEGRIYLLDRDNMGGFNAAGDSQIVQSLTGQLTHNFGNPAYFNGAVYFHATADVLKRFTLSGGLLSATPASRSNTNFAFPGATPDISANGNSSGIVWELDTSQFSTPGPAVLHAYDAGNVATELYNSNQNSGRDGAGSAAKFAVPTVANGKVFVGTQRQLNVYSLLP